MKLKNVKTILCVFLAAIFALGLAACGGSGSESGEQTGQQLNEFTGVALNDGSFTYDGEEHSLSVSGTIPDGTQVAYENNGQTDAGEYTVTATLTLRRLPHGSAIRDAHDPESGLRRHLLHGRFGAVRRRAA